MPTKLLLEPKCAPLHHASITAIGGDDYLFTGDQSGRILRWESDDNGVLVPSVWRSHGGGEVSGLHVSAGLVAWFENRQLWVGKVDEPESAEAIAKDASHYLAVRWSSDGGTLFAACSDGSVVSFSREAEWACETISPAVPRDWKYDWQRMIYAQIRADGSALFHGEESHRSQKRFLSIPSKEVLRTTKSTWHVWPDDDDTPWAIDILKESVAKVTFKSDRRKAPLAICAAAPEPPKAWTVTGQLQLSDRHRQLLFSYNARYADIPAQLAIVDLDEARVRQANVPGRGWSPALTRGAEHVLVLAQGVLYASSMSGEIKLAKLFEVMRTTLPKEPRFESAPASAWGLHGRVGLFANASKEVFSIDFEKSFEKQEASCTSHGSFPNLADGSRLFLFEGVLMASASGKVTAYDLASREELWQAPLRDALMEQGICAVPSSNSPTMYRFDPRTGAVSETLEAAPDSAPPGWRIHRNSLYDADGVARCRIGFEASWVFDPQGSGALLFDSRGVRYLRIDDPDAPESAQPPETQAQPSATQAEPREEPQATSKPQLPDAQFPPLERGLPMTAPAVTLDVPTVRPVHLTAVVDFSADEAAFSVDQLGRILKWDKSGAVTLWKLETYHRYYHVMAPVRLATSGSSVAWVEQNEEDWATLFVADINDASSRVAVAKLRTRKTRKLRFNPSGVLLVAFNTRISEPPEGCVHNPLVSFAFQPHDAPPLGEPLPKDVVGDLNTDWQASWLHHMRSFGWKHASLGPNGELLDVTTHREGKGGIELWNTDGDSRKTKLFGHRWTSDGKELIAASLDKGTIRCTARDSDRGKTLAKFDAAPLPSHTNFTWDSYDSALDKEGTRFALALSRKIGSSEVVVACLASKRARRIESPGQVYKTPRCAFFGDQLFVSTDGPCIYRADFDSLLEGGSFEPAYEADAPEPCVDGPRILAGEIAATRATPTHLWVLLNDRRILRMEFGQTEVETLGVMPDLEGESFRFEVVADAEGEVLVFAGADQWVAYDLSTLRCIWNRTLDDPAGDLFQDAHFGERTAQLLTVIDLRTGQRTGELQNADQFYQRPDEWRKGFLDGGWPPQGLLIDSVGQARRRVDKAQTRHIAADGSAGVAVSDEGLLVVEFRHEVSDD